MFSSTILDVAVGLVFSFLALSLATGMLVEGISSYLKLRTSTLRAGIGQLVNDPQYVGLAKLLYEHAAVNPRGTGADKNAKNQPAYVDARQFANALLDVTGLSDVAGGNAAGGNAAATSVQSLQSAINASKYVDSQMSQLLTGIVKRAAGDIDKIKKEIADWFDNGMDRLSGDYKRWSQATSVIIALFLAIALNVNALRIGQTLWEQPEIASQLTAKPDGGVDGVVATMTRYLPVGWPEGFLMKPKKASATPGSDPSVLEAEFFGLYDLASSIPGWILSALATLFGAPFWFDILQKAVRLKGTGEGPADKPQT